MTGALRRSINGPIDVVSTYTVPFWCTDCFGHDGFHVGEFIAWPIRCPSCANCFAEVHGAWDHDKWLVALRADLMFVRVRKQLRRLWDRGAQRMIAT